MDYCICIYCGRTNFHTPNMGRSCKHCGKDPVVILSSEEANHLRCLTMEEKFDYEFQLRKKYIPNLTDEENQQMSERALKKHLEREKRWEQEAAAEAARQAAKVTVTCPYCKSTNCSKISGLSKATSVVLWGVFSQKHKHQWHCNKCNSDF